MHLPDPVLQAVHDRLNGQRMLQVQGVAATRIVHVVTAVLGNQPVVGGVVDAPETEGRHQVVTLGGVLKRHNSTPVACPENSAKLTPLPYHVAPSG